MISLIDRHSGSVSALLVRMLSIGLLMVSGCMTELAAVDADLNTFAPEGNSIQAEARPLLEGVYAVREGAEVFGDSVVLRWVNEKLYCYAGETVVFAEIAGSVKNDTGRFNGYYRMIRSAIVGDLKLSIAPEDGGSELASEKPRQVAFVINGDYSPEIGDRRDLRLERIRAIEKKERTFHIIGHRAGARNSDRLGRSENSIEMAIFSEALGCTGIEIDIKVTKDGQLIVFHDDSFSPRTINSTYILGDIKDFTLAQIRRHATLVYGEKIPTLEEFFTAVIDSTKLSMIWLDVKDVTASEQIINAQLRALDHARDRGRSELQIYFGIASNEALKAFRNAPNADSADVLCELSAEVATSLKTCKVWAPRWTNGLQVEETKRMQQQGYEVLTWTLDSPDYIREYLANGRFDGILSNYPSLIAGLSR